MILLTGGTGFLGRSIVAMIGQSKIVTLSKHGADINCNLVSEIPKLPRFYDTVIHAAGRAHVVANNEKEKCFFFDVNVNGTANLLKGLENSGIPHSFIFISSVAVYGKESGVLINESENLSATDPYGLSKIHAEKLIQLWCEKHNVICTILRLPLVAGPNPPGNLGSMIKGIQKGYYFNINGGKARKSIVLAKDVAFIIPKVIKVGGVFNLTDGYHPSFKELSSVIAHQLNQKPPGNIPGVLAKGFAVVGDLLGKKPLINSRMFKKITSDLTFDDSKARKLIGWCPGSVLADFNIF